MNTPNQQTNHKRLEYIDALRGFIMIIIVYWHINYFSFDILKVINDVNSFENIFLPFGMPLFFFISGLFAYRDKFNFDWFNIAKFLGDKFKQLIIPTIIFLYIFLYLFNKSINNCLYDSAKNGYWFTIILFACFLLYIITSKLFNRFKDKVSYDILLIITALIVFITTISSKKASAITGIDINTLNALCYNNLHYYIYFILGVIVKRRFEIFEKYLKNPILIGLTIILFFIISLINIKSGLIFGNAIKLLIIIFLGISGSIVTFSFFYKYQDSFTKETKVGRVLQYIGKRTLDIYLLHYFFLPRNLQMVGEWFTENINPTLEFFVSLTLAAMVIALCLIVSNIIRISPLLANWLFGVKK